MAIKHVEIHQVAENQSALALTNGGRHFLHAVGVAFRCDVFFHPAAVVNVMNLAHSENANLSFREHIHQHRPRWVDGVVVAPRGPYEIPRRSSERKSTRLNSSH